MDDKSRNAYMYLTGISKKETEDKIFKTQCPIITYN